jgi:hypothetical protein
VDYPQRAVEAANPSRRDTMYGLIDADAIWVTEVWLAEADRP